MATIHSDNVSEEEARDRGVERLLADAAERPVRVQTEHGPMVIVPAGVIDEELAMLDDVYDSLLVITRMMTDTGARYSLDEAIAELGISEKEIAAASDD